MRLLSSRFGLIALLLAGPLFLPLAPAATYGPANETCTTTGGTVLTTGSAWESTIANAASGSVFLLRAGTYNFGTDSAGLLIPAGVTVKAYGAGTCENVLITGSSTADDLGTMLRMGANSTLRGVRVEASTTGNRHEAMLRCSAANVTLLNNTLFGGTGDSFLIDQNCDNWRLEGNDINGSVADNDKVTGKNVVGGHNIEFEGDDNPQEFQQPDNAVIRGNRICADYFPESLAGDDSIALQSGTNTLIEHNYWPSGCQKNRENILDIKTDTCGAPGAVTFRRNYIARHAYTGSVGGSDNGGTFQTYFTLGDHPQCGALPGMQHKIEYNVIGHCHGPVGASGAANGGCAGIATGGRNSSSIWRGNVFLQESTYTVDDNEARVYLGDRTWKTEMRHNIFLRGRFRMKPLSSTTGSQPTILMDNIYYDTFILDETTSSSMTTLSHNTFFDLSGSFDFWDSNNITSDPLFRDVNGTNPADVDLRLADGSPARGNASDGKNRGVFQEITYESGTIAGNSVRLKFTSDFLPLSKCTASLFDVEYNTTDATETACTPGPGQNEITLTMSAAPPAGANVTVKWSYGAVEDSLLVGGPEVGWNNKVRAETTAKVLQGVAEVPTWNQGNQVACSGSNRIVPVAFCWEKLAITTPMTITDVRVGGQLGTKIGDVDSPDGTLGIVGTLASLWYFNQAQLAAASNSTITYTTSEPQDADRPILVASGCYPDIPAQSITDSDVSTTTTLPALTTTNPGAAVVTGCAGTPETWTIGAPWQERLDVITGNTASQFVADAPTTGAALTPTPATVAPRVALVSAALGGGTQVPPQVGEHQQTHVAVYKYGEAEGVERICPVDGICDLAPTRRFVARAQVDIATAALPSTVFDWWCSDNGGDFYQVTPLSTGWISLVTSLRAADVLTNQLPLNGKTFQSCGTHYSIESPKAACTAAAGTRIEYEMAAVVSAEAVPGQAVVCELRKDPNTRLDARPEMIEIAITNQQAYR